jgi:hypothetical protein
LQSGVSVARPNHWRHFSALNHVAADVPSCTVTLSAGAGFDSDYEFGFRKHTLREMAGKYWRRAIGADPTAQFARAFSSVWPSGSQITFSKGEELLGSPMTAHKILAVHYANLLLRWIPDNQRTVYVEIGPGAGHLAVLMQKFRPGVVVILDLPEILPFSFLTLHRAFPKYPVWLPNEIGDATLKLPEQGLLFLTPGQVDLLPDACMDLGINTASFGEMLPEQIARYFALLRRINKPDGLFFACNRVEKWMGREGAAISNNVPGKGIPVRFDSYPWLPTDRDLLHETSAFHTIVQPENPTICRLCHLVTAKNLNT